MEAASETVTPRGATPPTRRPADPVVAVVLAWLVPGLGHAYAGRVPKGALLGGSIAVVFLAGMLIGGGGVVSWDHQPIWFLGHVFGGGCTALACLFGHPELAADPDAAHELGVLYTCVAALCNFLLMLDAGATVWRDRHPAPAAGADSAPAPSAEAVA